MPNAAPRTAPDAPPADTIVCPNIGPRQRTRRLRLGIFGTGLALATAATLTVLDAATIARMLVFPPLLLGMFGFFQYRARTCVRYAARGTRNLDAGPERVTSDAELAAMRAQARRVLIQAVTSAVIISILYLAIG